MKRIISVSVLLLSIVMFTSCGINQSEAWGRRSDGLISDDNKDRYGLSSSYSDSEYVPGDIVILGSYEQDGDLSNGAEPIEWQVIGARDGHTLILSKYALDCKEYNESQVGPRTYDLNWDTCTLRSWLNNEFYYDVFSDSDKKKIVTAHNDNPDSYELYRPFNYNFRTFGANGGNATNDQVFLLSWKEARDYLDGKVYNVNLTTGNYNQKLSCRPTDYAKTKGVSIYSNTEDLYPSDTVGCCWWWLRSPGDVSGSAAAVGPGGDIGAFRMSHGSAGVRPALLIDSNKSTHDPLKSASEGDSSGSSYSSASSKEPVIGYSELNVDASISKDWKQYDQLIDKIRTGTDFAARVDDMHKAEDILMSTFAVIPLYYYNDVYMKKPDVTGDYNTVYGIKYFKGMTKQGGDTIRINLASEPDYVDPALNSSADGASLVSNLFSGLYKYNDKSEVEPELADGMPFVSYGGKVYTIKLKPSKWSDGTDLTAKDFIYSWNRACDEKTGADYAYLFDIVARDADGKLKAVAKDDYTIEITLTNPCPYFDDLLAFPVFYPVPQKAVEAANTDGTTPGKWCQEAGFVCNGAYTMTEWKHNESITFRANPNYWDAANVKTPNLTFMLSADDTAIYAAYKNNDLDYIDSVPNDEMANLRYSKELYITPNIGTYYVAFNVKSDFFKNMTWQKACDFRHAICLLIDRQKIVDTVGKTGQQVADSFIPAGMADGNGGVFKTATTNYYDATKPDIESAVALLESAGYKMVKRADGTYIPDKHINLPYILNDNSGHKAIAECIQNDLSKVGINMTISTENWNTFLQNRKNGDYTFAREGWLADYNDPINMLEMFRSDSGNNDPQFGR